MYLKNTLFPLFSADAEKRGKRRKPKNSSKNQVHIIKKKPLCK
jgi:hypothetical protein